MLLLTGLGNPGPKYTNNRHNIGFMALDRIHARWKATPWRQRFQGEASEASIAGEKVLLLKPLTFMNESGGAVRAAMDFYKIALSEIYVLHDELDLAAGKLRMKSGGGNAGHNGLRSISAHCGNEYPRIRLGIGHPGDKALVHSFVLNDFAKAEMPWVEDLCDAVADHADVISRQSEFQNRVHRTMEMRGHISPDPKPNKKAGQEDATP